MDGKGFEAVASARWPPWRRMRRISPKTAMVSSWAHGARAAQHQIPSGLSRVGITLCNPRRCAGMCLARPLGRVALLCGHGLVKPYEPHGVCLVEFSDGFS